MVCTTTTAYSIAGIIARVTGNIVAYSSYSPFISIFGIVVCTTTTAYSIAGIIARVTGNIVAYSSYSPFISIFGIVVCTTANTVVTCRRPHCRPRSG